MSRILDRLGRSRTLVKPCISMIKFYRRVFFPFIDSSLLKPVMKRENSSPGGCALFPRTLWENKTDQTKPIIRYISIFITGMLILGIIEQILPDCQPSVLTNLFVIL